MSFKGDTLIEGGDMLIEGKTNGIGYREVREFHVDYYMVRFYFVTSCHGAYIESILDDFQNFVQPDIVMMNSSLWDITRYSCNHGCLLNIVHILTINESIPKQV